MKNGIVFALVYIGIAWSVYVFTPLDFAYSLLVSALGLVLFEIIKKLAGR